MSDKIFLLRYTSKDHIKNSSHTRDDREIYCFKEGNVSERVFKAFSYEINKLIGDDILNWIIAFIPASTADKTEKRYSKFGKRLQSKGFPVCFDAIYNKKDRSSTMITGKTYNPDSTFAIKIPLIKGKKVLLIDDVYTWGTSYSRLRERLLKFGAKEVYGMFLGKTTNSPNENPDDPVEWETTISPEDLEQHHFCGFKDSFDNFVLWTKSEQYGTYKRIHTCT